MKKLILLSITAIFLAIGFLQAQKSSNIHEITTSTKGDSTKEKLIGIWFCKESPVDPDLVAKTYFKILMADGTLVIFNTKDTPMITMKGEWHLKSDNEYVEVIKKSVYPNMVGTENKITVEFIDNNDIITKFLIEGYQYEEKWQKIN